MSKNNVENIKKAIKSCESLKKSLNGASDNVKREADKLLAFLYEGCLSKIEEMDGAFLNLEKSAAAIKAALEEKDGKSQIEDSEKSDALLNNIIIEQYRELENNIAEAQVKNTGTINKNIIDSAHMLYTNVCSENFKLVEELKKQIVFFRNVSLIMGVIILLFILLRT